MHSPVDAFDCVYVAVALHWIASDIGFAKSHGLLKASGHHVIMHRHHVSDEQGDAFSAVTQLIYRLFERDAVAGGQDLRAGVRSGSRARAHRREAVFAAVVRCVRPSRGVFGGGPPQSSDHLFADAGYGGRSASGGMRHLIDDRFAGRMRQHDAMSRHFAQKQ
jgi:hypothetical protein